MKYKYLVCAALNDELTGFHNVANVQRRSIGNNLDEIIIEHRGSKIRVATFTADTMGMPYNSARLMQVITDVDPLYVLFIGTCAGLGDNKIGTVLVPKTVFSYESGKLENGIFYPNYEPFQTSEKLRIQANSLKHELRNRESFDIITDEDFCSGSAVINDEGKAADIKSHEKRKLSGLDMEAYSLACIDKILRGRSEILVIKGISDLAFNKGQSEATGGKDLAIVNSSKFAFELIKYVEERRLDGERSLTPLRIRWFPNYGGTTHPVKVWFQIRNMSSEIVTIHSKDFILNSAFRIAPGAGDMFSKPVFVIGKRKVLEAYPDIFKEVCVLGPGESMNDCWLPLHPETDKERLKKACDDNSVGTWIYTSGVLNEDSTKNKLHWPIL